ncbi:hypothetical protein Slin15195_G084970 [Septoria linicola]|uniref:Uncharacterized protein n=1 Tax=Septoria linicola TaxID=215465 RepID=A0A9Q9AXT8_9PEZI|nr:hypothetical protein Slin14017_G087530 [Septoria linicola]USW55178.1 hypothetical protein Slin15195_G084970 [Septoria linicola]
MAFAWLCCGKGERVKLHLSNFPAAPIILSFLLQAQTPRYQLESSLQDARCPIRTIGVPPANQTQLFGNPPAITKAQLSSAIRSSNNVDPTSSYPTNSCHGLVPVSSQHAILWSRSSASQRVPTTRPAFCKLGRNKAIVGKPERMSNRLEDMTFLLGVWLYIGRWEVLRIAEVSF